MRLFIGLAVILLARISSAQAQQPRQPTHPRAMPSSLASVAVLINAWEIDGRWNDSAVMFHAPARIQIEYGQPHARGRRVIGGLVPYDSVWRTGASFATHLTTDVDLTVGDAFIPHGVYTLFTRPAQSGWKLIISRQTRLWGAYYDPSHDVARIDLRLSTRAEPLESFTIWLIPAADIPPRGILKMAWENTELSVPWRVGR